MFVLKLSMHTMQYLFLGRCMISCNVWRMKINCNQTMHSWSKTRIFLMICVCLQMPNRGITLRVRCWRRASHSRSLSFTRTVSADITRYSWCWEVITIAAYGIKRRSSIYMLVLISGPCKLSCRPSLWVYGSDCLNVNSKAAVSQTYKSSLYTPSLSIVCMLTDQAIC